MEFKTLRRWNRICSILIILIDIWMILQGIFFTGTLNLLVLIWDLLITSPIHYMAWFKKN